MQVLPYQEHHAAETLKKSIAKTVSYRIAILIVDFISIYLFTGKAKVAIDFLLVSNIYILLLGIFFTSGFGIDKVGENHL